MGYGLDVWGRIVAVDRVLNVQPQDAVASGSIEATQHHARGRRNTGAYFYTNETLTGELYLKR